MLGDARLAELAEAISDGTPIDWEKVGSSESDAERAILRELKVVADIVQLHRDLPRPSQVASRETIAESGMATGQWEEHWGHLRLLDKIGHGSFGDVYRAWDTRLDREVALKLLRQPQSRSAAAGTVIEEGRLLARVRHPNVVTVFGAERIDGRIGVWMEFIRGRTLEQHIRERGVFSAREAMLIASDLCRALSAVHKAGLLHRDLKAQNVMREDGGRIVLMDFGTGREQGQSGPEPVRDFAGTPLYLAPEILHGKPATSQSDVYSLGVLLFRLVTGEYPVAGRTLRDVSAAHDRGAHVAVTDLRPDLPDPFVQVLHRALATDPKARFETAGAMEHALSRALAEETPAELVPVRPVDSTPTPTPTPTPATAPPGRRVNRWVLVAALSTVVVGGLVAGAGLLFGWWDSGVRSIAVLPFFNATRNSTRTTDGIAEVLTANLNGIASLDVTSTTTMRLYKDPRKSVKEIGRELDVDYVVEGTMTDEGGRVRLVVSVIGSGRDRAVWNRTFEPRSDQGLLELQTDIARAIADGLGIELTPDESNRLQIPAATAALPLAQRSYSLGMARLEGPYQSDKEAAVTLLEDAVRQDPNFALAYVGLAEAHIRLPIFSTIKPRAESIRLAKEYAEKALRLSPRLPAAHVALARARMYFDWDWAGAEAEYRRALQIDPNNADANTEYAMFLAAFKRFDEALPLVRRARDADSANPARLTRLAAILHYGRQHVEALAEIEAALTIRPDYVTGWFTRGLEYTAMGKYETAIESIQRAVAQNRDPGRLADLARAYALAGDHAKARQTLEEMTEARRNNAQASPDKFAFVYAALGDMNRAFDYLHQAVDEKANNLVWLNVDPRWDQMRTDPRFASILARVGLNR